MSWMSLGVFKARVQYASGVRWLSSQGSLAGKDGIVVRTSLSEKGVAQPKGAFRKERHRQVWELQRLVRKARYLRRLNDVDGLQGFTVLKSGRRY